MIISWSPGEVLVVNINREKTAHLLNRAEFNDECISISFEKVHSDNTYLTSRKRCLKLGMLFVQTYKVATFENLILEANNMMQLDILGVSGTRWTDGSY